MVFGRLDSGFSDGECQHQARLVGEADVGAVDAEPPAYLPAALGEDHHRPAPGVGHEARVAYPHAVGEAGAERLHHCLLGRETHGQEAHRPLVAAEQLGFPRHQQAAHEMLAETLVGIGDTGDLYDVRADAEYQEPRAPCITSRIRATAGPSPSMTARAMMAWPMLSSTISGMAATGSTL